MMQAQYLASWIGQPFDFPAFEKWFGFSTGSFRIIMLVWIWRWVNRWLSTEDHAKTTGLDGSGECSVNYTGRYGSYYEHLSLIFRSNFADVITLFETPSDM